MYWRPSASWEKTDLTASPSVIECSPSGTACGTGGAEGSVTQRTAAMKYVIATTRIRVSAPAIFTTSGPSSANPIANAALSVSVKMPLAASS